MKRLYRYPDDGGMISGVCEGLGRYFDVDPALVRIVCGLLILFTGAAAILYVVAWICIPEVPYRKRRSEEDE